MDDGRRDEGPLSSEQMERENWRGGETILGDDAAGGHTLPESERDRATSGQDGRDSQNTQGAPSTILPPD